MELPRDEKGRFIKGYHYSPQTEFKKGQHWREPKPYWNKDWLYNEYVIKQKSSGDIAREQKCKEGTILYFLKKFGIKRRSIKEARKVKYWGLKGENNPMFKRRGELSPRWQGGKSPLRQKIYSKPEWKELYQEILKRDNYKCQICGTKHKSNNSLNIHHILPISCFPEFAMEEWNLATICQECHKKLHKAPTFRINKPEDLIKLILKRKIK